MTPQQNEAFTTFLRQKAAEAQGLGYHPSQFTKMLNSMGGDATVKQLLSKGQPTEGFARLWRLGRLDLTVEALAVESEWRPFFDPILLGQAEKLLRRSGYDFTPYAGIAGAAAAATTTPPAAPRPAQAPVQAPTTSANTPAKPLSFSAFCKDMGAPLANVYDRWCSYNPNIGLSLFNLWADRLRGDHYRLWTDAELSQDSRVGAKELRRVLRDVMAAGHTAYGILSEAKDVHASIRDRARFDSEQLLALRLEADGADIIAWVLGMVPAADVKAGRHLVAIPFDSAIDDLDTPPLGQEVPERTTGRIGTGYRRDPEVRNYVLARAKGHCEHCGALGFEMDNGRFYLEAHHVIALAARGPDTVANVIALCANHHRQAHYGKDSEGLEAAFLDRLRTINGS